MAHEPFSPVPEVTPTGPAGNYENIQANPSQFGGLIGGAEQRFGAQGEAAGNTLFQGALARQQWTNEVNTDAAFNNLQAGYQKLLHGDPDKPNDVGFYGLRGQDAVNAYKPTSDAMEQLRTSLKNSLTSPMAQLRFDTESRRLQMFTTGDMGRHYDNESGHVAAAVNQATEDINLRQIELNPADEENYQRSLDTATKGAVRRIQTQYGLNAPPEIVNSAIDSLTSKAIVRRALAWGERGADPAAAMSWLETQRQHVDPAAFDQVVNHLKGKADDTAVEAGINEATGAAPAGSAKAPPSGVFPPSANAPWIENRNDGTPGHPGTTVSQYVDKVMARYQQNGGDIVDAIKNGGERSGATQVSTKGAAGTMQVTPGFFQQYAHQGESFDNEADRVAVGERGIAALKQKYNNDPQRVAVAYFSGEQNVAPATGSQPASGAAAAGGAKPFVIGDSIGQGVRMAGRLEGNVETGATPDMILHGITGSGGDAVKGRDVVLSSGISNDPRPQQLAVVEQQIDALKAKGAGNITLLGVGSRPDFAGINDRLAQLAQQKGVTFSGPLTNLSPDQVHPANYGPLALSVTQQQASLPGGGVQPHNPAAYGQEATMMANAEQVAGRLFPVGSEGYKKIVDGAWQKIQRNNMLQQKYEAEQAKAQKDAQEGVMNDAITTLHTDPTKFDPRSLDVKDANGNYVLTPQQRDTMYSIADKHLADAGKPDISKYGSAYTQIYNGIFAPEGDPNRVATQYDILKRAAPGGDLTLAGAEVLTKVLAASQKSPDEAGIHGTAASLMTYAKNNLSFENDTGIVKIRDPKGEAIFNSQFVPKFEKMFSDWRAAGKDPWQFLTKENVDKLMQGMRSPTQMAKDRLIASGMSSPEDIEKPGAPIPEAPSPLDAVKDFPLRNAPGMVEPGNLDPWNRPVLHNPDGGYSTTSSISIGTDKGETVIPTVVDGKRLSEDEAVAHYRQTGENFGTFKTPDQADDFATKMHNAQAKLYDEKGNPLPSVNKSEWSNIMSVPPTASTGRPFTHAAWAKVLGMLLANPTQGVKDFDEKFGPAGYSGEEILRRLKTAESGLPESYNQAIPGL